ncbi:hypothetical protein NQ318_021149 [Aromia moschata]|uniref:Prolactin receptor n=1 Tax=Aromia moschata TaxID=1265417 RepID=A0AAV8YGJ1_9CUCU|nr:hypothetical protein NQ318_021149 [Aromia moschata]
MLEISVKQNGENKDKPSQEPEQNSSYKYIGASRSQNKSIDYMKGMELQNTINSSEEKLSNEDEIIHLPDKNLEDTDSEINENDVLAANKFAATKGSKQDLMNWPTEDLKKIS